MSTAVPAGPTVSSSGSTPARSLDGPRRIEPLDVLVLSAWCGLAGGLLEVGTRVLCRHVDPTNRLDMLSRHFIWLAPLSTLLFFSGLGLILAPGTKLWPRRGAWLSTRFLCFWAVLPALIVAGPRVYPAAWALLALGIASRMAQVLEKRANGLRRRLMTSFPALLGTVLVLAMAVFGGDWLKQRREANRPLPPADSPNVLLVVLDTVRADRLSLYGYERPTSPALERLAKRGIRFDEARATAPWTLPSHASFFTGRWPHEIGAEWLTPLVAKFPTLAEYLGARGYATAGFVANTLYCSRETGLDRGFTHYEDYVLEGLMPLRTAWLVDHVLQMVSDLGVFAGQTFDVGPFRPTQESWFASLFVVDRRKDAGAIDRGFVEWLEQRRQPARPFFAFLNFYDAHAPYVLPRGIGYIFGLKPQRPADFSFLIDYWDTIDKMTLRPAYRNLASDSYDNCLAYLDARLGQLFDELGARGVLDRTLVIVTADHGEGLGDHDLFDHGESLYRPEIRVPLLIVLPEGRRAAAVVRETVSLRDLPTTIVELAGLADGSPFPGRSMAHFWRDRPAGEGSVDVDAAISELAKPNPYDPNHGRSPARRGPLTALAEGNFAYIRNEKDGTEELFNEHDDPGELHNLVQVPAKQDVLERFRRRFDLMKARPPQRVP